MLKEKYSNMSFECSKIINSQRVLPWFYAQIYPHISDVAIEHGYALSVHGSMRRDFDLIAVPWVEEASDTLTLVEAIRKKCNGYIDNKSDYPARKPHGRWAWVIHLGGGCYIDLSVLPRYKEGKPINWEEEKKSYGKECEQNTINTSRDVGGVV